MDYLAAWRILEKLVTDFRKRGHPVPTEVMSNLKVARVTLRTSKTDEYCGESAQKIEQYLANLEAYLISEGQKAFGSAYADEWLRRLAEARKSLPEKKEEKTRLISGVPRGQKWISVSLSEELPAEKLKTLAQQSGLGCKVQTDRSLIVYGSSANMRDFIRRMTAIQSRRNEKQRQGTT